MNFKKEYIINLDKKNSKFSEKWRGQKEGKIFFKFGFTTIYHRPWTLKVYRSGKYSNPLLLKRDQFIRVNETGKTVRIKKKNKTRIKDERGGKYNIVSKTNKYTSHLLHFVLRQSMSQLTLLHP